MTNSASDAIVMTAVFTVTEPNLEIDYSLVNRSAHPVFVLDTTVIIDAWRDQRRPGAATHRVFAARHRRSFRQAISDSTWDQDGHSAERLW